MLKPYDVEQAAAEISSPVMSKQSRSPRKPKVKKLFVLDTNVLMHDPTSLFRFDEHDLYLPIATLEELDTNKRGLSDVDTSKALDFEIPPGRATVAPSNPFSGSLTVSRMGTIPLTLT